MVHCRALSLECRLISAPRPPMHFCHKTFPGTSNNISHRTKFQGSGCLISWLPKIRSLGLASWLSTFFSQISALLNLIFTVHKLYTRLTHPQLVGGVSGMSLVSLIRLFCPWHIHGVPDKSLVSLKSIYCLKQNWGVYDLNLYSSQTVYQADTSLTTGWWCQACLLCPWYPWYCVPNQSEVILLLMWYSWDIFDILDM